MSGEKLYLYPIWLRIWHGVNAVSIVMLIITGVAMQYAAVENPFISFDTAITVHNVFGVITAISYIYFFFSNFLTGNIKAYAMSLNGLVDRLILQSKYYLFGYFKGEPKPFPVTKDQKFNPLQRVAYVGTMYFLVPVVVITGVALLFPDFILETVFETSGIRMTAILHSIVGFFISLFLLIHLYIASVGKHPLKNYRSIVTGYHEHD